MSFYCYVSMKEVGILYVQLVCERRVLREFYLSVRGGQCFYPPIGVHTQGTILLISELAKDKGFIILLEGKMWSGWRGFGKTVAEEEPRLCTSGIGNKGKEKILGYGWKQFLVSIFKNFGNIKKR